jgi:hypothetical protein
MNLSKEFMRFEMLKNVYSRKRRKKDSISLVLFSFSIFLRNSTYENDGNCNRSTCTDMGDNGSLTLAQQL